MGQISPQHAKPTINQFWDEYEAQLVASINLKPQEYHLLPGETPEDYARNVRARFQFKVSRTGDLGTLSINTPTFRRTYFAFCRCGSSFSQSALRKLYASLEGPMI